MIEICKRSHYNISELGRYSSDIRKTTEFNFTRINSKGLLTLQDLVDRTGCSASTIRRDLSKLQNMGKLQRVHGGATIHQNRVKEPKLSEKELRIYVKNKKSLNVLHVIYKIMNVYF